MGWRRGDRPGSIKQGSHYAAGCTCGQWCYLWGAFKEVERADCSQSPAWNSGHFAPPLPGPTANLEDGSSARPRPLLHTSMCMSRHHGGAVARTHETTSLREAQSLDFKCPSAAGKPASKCRGHRAPPPLKSPIPVVLVAQAGTARCHQRGFALMRTPGKSVTLARS